ncbi:head GIN domain-containing protein [Ulvibacterium sp.]|uniref:head GIN domain-containing protein n=1 Tax=Ulvibacterium sp. TaxID=2665914 RepID=UPI00261A1F90|nr:head GIN domain-containing protein [Ulvibacterium sp.]
MKSVLVFAVLIVLSLQMVSCDYETIRASDRISTVGYGFTDYSRLQVSNAFNVYIRFSDVEESIEVEANDNIQDRIIIQKEGNTLRVRLKNHTNLRGNVTLNVFITTREISDFDISGASNVTLESPLSTREVDLEVSGASSFSGEMNLTDLDIRASGASHIDVFGNTESLRARLSGSSDLKDYDLEIAELDIDLSGASDAYLTVTESIDIEASGASTLRYRGDATVNLRRLSGASEIIKTD